ncbi:hypothetical protein OKW22_000222 [Bacilli bacterium PM5-3]|nr:hypothetical protein [Bacilli bacterium PM5-3]
MKKIIIIIMGFVIFVGCNSFNGYSQGKYTYYSSYSDIDEEAPKVVSNVGFTEEVKNAMLEETNGKIKCLIEKNNLAVCFYKSINFNEINMIPELSFEPNNEIVTLTVLDSGWDTEYISSYILLDLNKYSLPKTAEIKLKDIPIHYVSTEFKNDVLPIKKVSIDFNILEK